MPCDGSCASPVHSSLDLADFTQSSWYTSLYSNPTSALLDNNDPPADNQLPSLRVHQLEAIAELQTADQKVRSLQSLLSDAIAHRDRLQKVVDDYRSVLSPIRRVPFEIVHGILEINGVEGWGRATDVWFRPKVRLYNGPWRLSRVCQDWRAVAIQSTEFWCSVRIYTTSRAECASLGLCKLLDEGVERSAKRGLQVMLKCNGGPLEESYEPEYESDEDRRRQGVDVYRALFSKHSNQMRVLDIEGMFSHELDFIHPANCTFHSLRCLSIQILEIGGGIDDDMWQLLDAFEEAFDLTEVKLDGVHVGKHCDDVHFPWHNLQRFEHNASLSLDDALAVLIRGRKLQKYIVSDTVTRAFTITLPRPFLHPALTYLELSAKSISLLQYIKIPSLTVLHLKDINNSQLIHLTQFISQSQCSIQVLDISVSDAEFHLDNDSFLELLPSVTRLTLGLKSFPQLDKFQSALTPERFLCLEVLEIRVQVHSDPLALCTPQLMSTLIHIIRSRSTRLQSFTFYLTLYLGPFLGWWKSMREGIEMLRGLLAPYHQELRTRIDAGTKLRLFLGALSSSSLHVDVLD
jgi:hypothetical protein